jgi:plastocyanin
VSLSARKTALLLLLCVTGARAGDVAVEVRDAKGAPVAEAVVYAEPVGSAPPPARANSRATIDQVGKEFVPRVTIVQAGTEVFFPNSDNIRHSIYSFSPAKTFTTKLYSGREAPPVLFDKTGMVVLGCNIHDKMVAWVLIVDTPWIAKGGADGLAILRGLPAGEYRVSIAAPATALKPATQILRVEAAHAKLAVTLDAGS